MAETLPPSSPAADAELARPLPPSRLPPWAAAALDRHDLTPRRLVLAGTALLVAALV
ncbi:MAG: hypothetical protein JWM05_2301, partial [Acidimicrobiales bacterium]|nr:hypothetical protein [Acidimicrobiales bacterium]